jgi:hypothetical protein
LALFAFMALVEFVEFGRSDARAPRMLDARAFGR